MQRARQPFVYAVGGDASFVRTATIDATRNAFTASWAAPKDPQFGLSVYSAAVSSDRHLLAVGYQGPADGVDLFDAATGAATRCAARPFPRNGCIHAHGSAAFLGRRVLKTTGGEVIQVRRLDGKLVKSVHTKLENNHVMDFALDRRGRMFVSGQCFYVGGSRADLASGRSTLLTPGGSRAATVCGQVIAVAGDGTIILGGSQGGYGVNVDGFVEGVSQEGRLRWRIRTRGYPAALATG